MRQILWTSVVWSFIAVSAFATERVVLMEMFTSTT